MHKERNRPHDPNGIPTRNRPQAKRRSRKAEPPPGTALIPLKPAKKRARRGKAASAPAPVILMPPPVSPLLLPSPAALAARTFPAGLVAPPSLGVTIRSVAMPDIPLCAASATPVRRKPRAEPKLPETAAPPSMKEAPAIPLPATAEPLVNAKPLPDDRSAFTPRHFITPETALPRARALAKPSTGLAAAIGAWLSSFGKMIAAGFMVKKTRKRTMPHAAPIPPRPITPLDPHMQDQTTMRERTEMLQLRAENRRLRAQLEALEAMRGKPTIPRWSERQKEKMD